MARVVSTLVLFFTLVCAYGNGGSPVSRHFYLVGKIDTYGVQMDIAVYEDNTAAGWYYYERYGKKIELRDGLVEGNRLRIYDGAFYIKRKGNIIERLKLEELVAEKTQDRLAALEVISAWLIADLKKQGGNDAADGQITSFEYEDINAFTVAPAGITIYFSPYAVGPYAAGDFKVQIPWKAKSIIYKESPLQVFLQ